MHEDSAFRHFDWKMWESKRTRRNYKPAELVLSCGSHMAEV